MELLTPDHTVTKVWWSKKKYTGSANSISQWVKFWKCWLGKFINFSPKGVVNWKCWLSWLLQTKFINSRVTKCSQGRIFFPQDEIQQIPVAALEVVAFMLSWTLFSPSQVFRLLIFAFFFKILPSMFWSSYTYIHVYIGPFHDHGLWCMDPSTMAPTSLLSSACAWCPPEAPLYLQEWPVPAWCFLSYICFLLTLLGSCDITFCLFEWLFPCLRRERENLDCSSVAHTDSPWWILIDSIQLSSCIIYLVHCLLSLTYTCTVHCKLLWLYTNCLCDICSLWRHTDCRTTGVGCPVGVNLLMIWSRGTKTIGGPKLPWQKHWCMKFIVSWLDEWQNSNSYSYEDMNIGVFLCMLLMLYWYINNTLSKYYTTGA